MTRETAESMRNNFEQVWPILEATLKRWVNLDESPRDFRSVAPAFDFKSYVFTKEDRKTLDANRVDAQRQFDGRAGIACRRHAVANQGSLPTFDAHDV